MIRWKISAGQRNSAAEVTRVVTPGTALDETRLTEDNNFGGAGFKRGTAGFYVIS